MSGFSVNVHSKVAGGAATVAAAEAPGSSVAACAAPAPVLPAGTSAFDRFVKSYDAVKATLLQLTERVARVDPHRRAYLAKMMDVTCLGGKYNRGVTVVEVTAELLGGAGAPLSEAARDAALFDACVCGWMVEMMQAHFLVEDDIMDSSITRRGKPCWYRHPGVTTQCAINDGLILLAWCTQLAYAYFGATKPALLAKVLALFHMADFQTTMGQLYDVTSMFDSAKLDPDVPQPTTTDYLEFTIEHYRQIVTYKTAYYTYHLPLVFGLAVAEAHAGAIAAAVPAATVERLAMLMGEYFQVQDDVLDCFADPSVIGKIGTDIQDTKCSWLAVTFMSVATPAQVATFKAHYGKHDDADVAIIKQLYRDTDLQGRFDAYEAATVTEVEKLLAEAGARNPPFAAAARKLWEKTYKRKK